MAAGIGRAKIDKRRGQILELLASDGKVYISDLCRRFGTSPVTIRSDLDTLAADGKLIRMTGGAVSIRQKTEPQTPTIDRYEQKKELAVLAASRIENGTTLFINSGTTTALVAKELKTKKHLNIVTNSLAVAEELLGVPTLHVILLGGSIHSGSRFTYGENAREQLSRFGADVAILSVDGVSREGEISTCHAEEAILDRLMIGRAGRVLIVADRTKLGRTGFSFVGRCDDHIEILTNSQDS